MPTTTGMKGAGYYDRHSTAQQSTIQALQDWLDAAIADVPLSARDEPVTVNAIHWLDSLPSAPLPDGVVYRQPHLARPGLAAPPEITAAFARQAEQDLTRFLECRAQELVPGAKLLLAGPGATDEVPFARGLVEVYDDACLDLVASGRLGREAYEHLVWPCYFRTVAELLAPLEREDSPVRGAFTVDRAEAREVPPPFLVEFRRNGDAAAFAAACTGFLRAVTEPVVRAALHRPEGASGAIEFLYERIRDRLLADPGRYPWSFMVVAAVLTRR